MNIPFFPYNKIFQNYSEKFRITLDNILTNGQYILGKELQTFEKNISLKIKNK